MRLFHVSEESGLDYFEPRPPKRTDLDQSIGLVWAIDEQRLPNFLTPRDCPRVTYHIGKNTTAADREKYFTSPSIAHTVIIEHQWYPAMKGTTLFLYEFDPAAFTLQDQVAGYYTATAGQRPIRVIRLDDLFAELMKRNVEIRMVDNLWHISDVIQTTTLNWSMCRMSNVQKRPY